MEPSACTHCKTFSPEGCPCPRRVEGDVRKMLTVISYLVFCDLLERPLIMTMILRIMFDKSLDTQKSIDGMVKYLLNTISGSFHLVGLSMGGIIAMTVAIKDPSRVKSMVLMDTSPHIQIVLYTIYCLKETKSW